VFGPSAAHDPVFRSWWARLLRQSATPASIGQVSGAQPAILDRDLFDAVQAKLNEQRTHHTVMRSQSEALLIGRIYDDRGNRKTPSHVRKGGMKYRYYLSSPLLLPHRPPSS
jgi:hypothetical protein